MFFASCITVRRENGSYPLRIACRYAIKFIGTRTVATITTVYSMSVPLQAPPSQFESQRLRLYQEALIPVLPKPGRRSTMSLASTSSSAARAS